MTQISADPANDSSDPIGLDGVPPSADTEKLYDITTVSGDALAVLAGERVVYVNDAAVQLFGADPTDLIGKTPWQISPITEIDGVAAESVTREYIREAYDHGEVRFEWHHERPDGVTLHLEVSLTRIDLPEGQRILITFRDVSNIVVADRLLRSHSEFQSLLTRISNTLVTADADRIGEHINESLRRIGERYELDLVRLWWYRSGEDAMFCSHDWSSDGSTVAGRKVAFERISWATRRVWGGGGYHFKSLDEYPEEASQDRAYTEGEGIKSIFVTPILIEG
ncbi:MAG: PAS domain-containing protein, partial [Gammaproteobacteria bacterium]|nr:PAS domain-containing protein [Gammaproteobacteria bacterium]